MNKRCRNSTGLWMAAFLLVSFCNVPGQTAAGYREIVYLHLDREVFISGEEIRFKVYVLDGNSHRLSGLSRVVYVELLNLQNRPVVNVKIRITGGTGDGYLQLPGSLLSENYSVRACTRWMQNFDPEFFFSQQVIVVNPFIPMEAPVDSSVSVAHGSDSSEEPVLQLNGKIETDKAAYSSREKCTIQINTCDLNGDPVEAELSVSVRSAGYSGLVMPCSVDDFLERVSVKMAGDESVASAGLKIPAETRGLALHGRISNYNRGSGTADRVFLSRIDSMPDIYVAEVSADGRFYMNLRDQYGDYDWILESDEERYNSGIRINSGFSAYSDTGSLQPLIFHLRLRELVEKQMVNYQVSRQFSPTVEAEFDDPGRLPFYGKPDETIRIDEYINLPATEEFFTELVKSVLLEVQGDEYILKILNPIDNQILPGTPLVLFDGVPLCDLNLLMAIDPRRLLKIDVVNSRYVIGDHSFGGIISVQSRRGDHSDIPAGPARQINFQAFQPPRRFNQPVYETEEQAGDRRPDFRTLLHWDPEVQTDSAGGGLVEFYTSDETGSYIVVVQGITASGDPVYLEQVIEVKGR